VLRKKMLPHRAKLIKPLVTDPAPIVTARDTDVAVRIAYFTAGLVIGRNDELGFGRIQIGGVVP
jgi:hypothetical protein